MVPEPNLAGFLLYLGEIFLPGIGFAELLQLWKKEDSLLERIGLALGLGLSIDTIVLLVRTSGVLGLKGVDTYTLYGMILAGLAALFISFARKRKLWFPKPTKVDFVLIAFILVQSFILILYFTKYPIFPEYQSQDYAVHVQLAQGLISGSTTSVPSGILYYGIHYQLASGLLFVGGEPLVTVRQTMAILVVLSSILFFSSTKRIFQDTRIALVTTGIYVFSGTIWFASVFDSGLFANFYGILAAMFLLIALNNIVGNWKSSSAWIIFLISVVNAYMSHYTLLTILPAILLLPFLNYFMAKDKRQNLRGYLFAALVIIAPAIIPLVLIPGLGQRIISLASSGGGLLTGSTTLSNLFSSLPVLSYLALEVNDDYALIAMLILSILYLYRIFHLRNPIHFVPIVWFFSLIVAAPNDTSAWRFSYEALVPLTLMAGFGLSTFFGKQSRGKSSMIQRKSGSQESVIPRAALIIIIFAAILIGSWGQAIITDSVTDSGVVSQSQASVYNSIYWLRDNTPNNSKYLSVSDWKFLYTNLIIGRISLYEYVGTPLNSITIARNESANYIIVTNVLTVQLPSVPSLFPWNNFPTSSNSNLTLVYQNSDVRIYQIVNFT